MNPYTYVENDPLGNIDPSGHFSIGIIVKIAVSVATSFARSSGSSKSSSGSSSPGNTKALYSGSGSISSMPVVTVAYAGPWQDMWTDIGTGWNTAKTRVSATAKSAWEFFEPDEYDVTYYQAGGMYGPVTGVAGYIGRRGVKIGGKIVDAVTKVGKATGRMTAKQATELAKKLGFEKQIILLMDSLYSKKEILILLLM